MPDATTVTEAPPAGPPDPLLGATPAETFERTMADAAAKAGNTPETKPVEKAPATEKPVETKGPAVPESLLKTKEAKPVEPDPDAVLEAEPKGQLSHENYKALKAAAKAKIDKITAEFEATKKERDDYKGRAGKPTPELDKELSELREQLREARATLEQEAYQRTPEFQERFTSREQNIRAQAEGVLKAANVDTALLDAVLHGVGRNRFAPLAETDLSDAERSHIHSLVAQYDLLQPEKKAALEQSHERMTKAQQERARAQEVEKSQRVAEEAVIFESVHKDMTTRLDAFQKAEGEDETAQAWNTDTEKLQAEVVKFLNGDGDFKKFAEISFKGFAYDQQARLTAAWRARAEAQAEELARLKAASPSAAGANGTRTAGEGKYDPKTSPYQTWAEMVENRA